MNIADPLRSPVNLHSRIVGKYDGVGILPDHNQTWPAARSERGTPVVRIDNENVPGDVSKHTFRREQ